MSDIFLHKGKYYKVLPDKSVIEIPPESIKGNSDIIPGPDLADAWITDDIYSVNGEWYQLDSLFKIHKLNLPVGAG